MKRWVVLLLWVSTLSSLSALNLLKSVTIHHGALRLSFATSIKGMQAKHFILKNGHSVRYVFDFPHTMIRKKTLARGLSAPSVTSFRVSQFNQSTVRLVVEVAETYQMAHASEDTLHYRISLPHSKGTPKRHLSDLFASIGKAGIAVKSSSRSTHTKKRTTVAKRSKKATKRPKKRYTVVVDPGHGGKDSGALGGRGYMEKTVVLRIARRVRDHLKKLGFRVYMTRNSNHFVKLGKRTHYANLKHADAFVSIHANAVSGKRRYSAEGIETYFLQVSRSARSKRVAARENSVVLRAKDHISKNVLLNLMTGPKIVMSNKMAIDVQRSMLKNVRKRFHSVKDNGVRPAPFWVLVGAQMPAVLVETGYITHSREKKRLFNSHYQDAIAKGIAEGISNYFANREKEME